MRDYDAHLNAMYGPDLDGEDQPENQPDPEVVSHDRYTVSGNSLRMWRLGPDGQPVGEAIEFPGPVKFDIPAEDVEDTHLDPWTKTFTMDLTMQSVAPELLALLTGYTADEEIEVWDGRTRWQRWLDNHPVLRWVLGGYDMSGGPGFWDRLLNATFDYRETRKMVDRWDAEDQR